MRRSSESSAPAPPMDGTRPPFSPPRSKPLRAFTTFTSPSGEGRESAICSRSALRHELEPHIFVAHELLVGGYGRNCRRLWANALPIHRSSRDLGAGDTNPQTQPSERPKPINSVAELDGDWSGEKDGVKVELHFDSKHGPFAANWTVIYAVPVLRPAPQEPPTMEVRKGAELRPVVKDGRLELFLPAYLGQNPALRRSAWNGKRPVGQIDRRADGAIQFRIIPTGYQDLATADYDFPSVRAMVLHGIAKDSE